MLVITAVCWGLAGVCIKSISWGTMSQTCARSFLSLLVLLAFKGSCKIKWTKWNVLGALAMSATGMIYIQAVKMTTAGTAIVLQYIAPILVFLFAVLFQHRKAKLSELLITLAVFGGIVLSFADSLDASHVIGNLLAIASGFTFAAQIIIMGREGTDSQDSLIIACMISMTVAFPFMLQDASLVLDAKNLLWVGALGIFQYGMANVCFAKGIQRVGPVEGSLILTIEPIFNPIPVALFCGEKMGTLAILGSAVVIIFVTLYAILPTLEQKRAAKTN